MIYCCGTGIGYSVARRSGPARDQGINFSPSLDRAESSTTIVISRRLASAHLLAERRWSLGSLTSRRLDAD